MSSHVHRVSAFFLAIAITILITACGSETEQSVIDLGDTVEGVQRQTRAERPALLFGFDLRNSPQEDARQYLPFLDYLTRTTGYQFELRFTPRGQRLAEQLGQGQVDVAAVGAVSYIRAHEKYGARILVRGLNRENRADYQACIVVGPESPLHGLEDLRGKTFAFGAMASTQGHLIPRLMLQQKNIHLSDLRGHQYTGSHQRCAEAVISGRFAACGMQDTLARRLGREGVVRILACSRPYPSSGIASAPDVPAGVAEKIRQALLEFDPRGKHAGKLYHWERTEMPNGFIAAGDDDYRELRQAMIRFGMLDGVKPAESP